MRHLLLLLLLMAPTAAALDEERSSLYLIRAETDYASTSDPTEYGQGGFWGSAIGGVVGSPYAGDGREWVFPYNGDLNHTLTLDPNGTVAASIWIGGGDSEAGQHNVGFEIKNGGTVIAAGKPQTIVFTVADGSQELTWTLPPQTDTIDNTTLSVRVYSENGYGSGIRIGLGDGQGGGMRSIVSLPIMAMPDEPAPAGDEPTDGQDSPVPLVVVVAALFFAMQRRRRQG